MKRISLLVLALGLLGCNDRVVKSSGPDGSTPAGQDGGAPTGACSSLGECACLAASDRCTARSEACWCPSCDPGVVCVCGGGKFLRCEDKTAANSCDSELARVQTLCAGKPFVGYIGGLCSTSADADCVATCLAGNILNVDSCAQIDCYFCPVCDCLAPPPSALRTCLAACAPR
jgi:hypothetical protein